MAVSALSFLISAAHFIYDVTATSRLTVSVSDFEVTYQNLKRTADGEHFDFDVTFQGQLTNVGKAPATLIRILYVTQLNEPGCPHPTEFDWDFGTGGGVDISKKEFRAIPLSIPPQVVGGLSIVNVDGRANRKDYFRPNELLGQNRLACLAFLSLDAEGKRHIKVVPAIQTDRVQEEAHSINHGRGVASRSAIWKVKRLLWVDSTCSMNVPQ